MKEDATTRDDASTLKEPSVREDLLQELTELMGFGRNKAVRALYYSKADSAERAIDWIERHEDDADVNEPLLVEDEGLKAREVKTVSKMTPEEAKAKADELRRNAAAKKAERLLEEKEMERLREQERIRSGKELLEAKKLEDELSLKRNAEQRAAEKAEMDRARARDSRENRRRQTRASTKARIAGGVIARGDGGGASTRGGACAGGARGDSSQGCGGDVRQTGFEIGKFTQALGGH